MAKKFLSLNPHDIDGGDGRKFVAFNHGEREYDPCDDCADLRTLLERAKGEV